MDQVTKEKIAEFICGDNPEKHPVYRSSSYLTRFFQEIGLNYRHDGSTRKWWVLDVINALNGHDLQKVILRLAAPRLYGGDRVKVRMALKSLNELLAVESLKVVIDGVTPVLQRQEPNFNYSEEVEDEPELVPLPPPDFQSLQLETGIAEILDHRWGEIQKCIDNEANVASVILMGSLLEGFLLGVMQKFPRHANTVTNAPRGQDGNVKQFPRWTFSEMINVAHSVGWIELDVKKFSHALRDFRNIIHPYQQMVYQTYPDIDTAKISWLVVQAACNDIASWMEATQSNNQG